MELHPGIPAHCRLFWSIVRACLSRTFSGILAGTRPSREWTRAGVALYPVLAQCPAAYRSTKIQDTDVRSPSTYSEVSNGPGLSKQCERAGVVSYTVLVLRYATDLISVHTQTWAKRSP